MSFIEVRGVSKSFKVLQRGSGLKNALKAFFRHDYKVIKAVDDISFEITKGEIVAYIGPNGAGKSTTIKMLCGILKPDSGECIVDGMNPFENRINYVSKIGVVFGQKSQLWWDIPVDDSFNLLKAIYNIDEEKYQKTKNELVHILELEDILKTPVRQLSLGQRMRAEIAASLLHNPKILFLDEPTIGLDAVSKVAVRSFIKKINETQKVTVILTSHDMSDVEALTNRVIVIGHGRKLYDGSLSKIKKQFTQQKQLEIICKKLQEIPDLPNAEILEKSRNRVLLRVDLTRTTVSKIVAAYSKVCEIVDINVIEEDIDNIIIKLYEEYHI
jgi:ABC-2 type transport system ATP-binding protein